MTGRHSMDSTMQWLWDFCAQCRWLESSTKTLHATLTLCSPTCMHWQLPPSDFMTCIQDCEMKIQTKHWPSFLYDERVYGREECDKGLLKGYLLLWVHLTSFYLVVCTTFSLLQVYYHHTLTSPSSAIGKVRKGRKPSKAQIYGMKLLAVTQLHMLPFR